MSKFLRIVSESDDVLSPNMKLEQAYTVISKKTEMEVEGLSVIAAQKLLHESVLF